MLQSRDLLISSSNNNNDTGSAVRMADITLEQELTDKFAGVSIKYMTGDKQKGKEYFKHFDKDG